MAQADCRNDFLLGLLALQQDGRYAISAPTNWIHHGPLLEISTDIDRIIEDLSNKILSENKKNDTACWHFFVGSPGNGKSAAMGKLCKRLISNKGCKVLDEDSISIEDLEPTKIPYSIFIREGDNNFASAQIVQDASVVPNPFSPGVDPALELLKTLSHSWDKGISLVVCTNRGVLEKAHRDNLGKHDINTTPWFKILKAIVEAEQSLSGALPSALSFDSKKKIFNKVSVGYSHLDNHSLLLGRDTFDQLIQKAIMDPSWENCVSCTSQAMCPFKANRESISDTNIRQNFLNLLTKSEVLSGQVIVFREALAIISLILSGCPRDYGSMHPCDWVRLKIANQDFFSLATRRLYMSVFTPYSPYGLDPMENLREKQKNSIEKLRASLEDCLPDTITAITHVINDSPPCTDVGVPRLLGENGIIANLDPCNDSLPYDFYQKWDSYFDFVPTGNISGFSQIEIKCISIWKDLEENLENLVDHSVSDAHWAIRRWSSNFMLHFGALYEGKTSWAKELDEFITMLSLMSKAPHTRTIEEKRRISNLDSRLEILLNSSKDRQSVSTVKLSEKVTLGGKWVQGNLKPKTATSVGSGNISLAIIFPDAIHDGKGERAVFVAPMYLWLNRRAKGFLDNRCFPQELLTGVEDARIRAASKGKYAVEDNDIELIIDSGDNKKFTLSRFDGEVDVNHE